MDKNHRLDAPDNEALRTIGQLDDHSELSTIYPSSKQPWAGGTLMSQEERYKKRDKEQQNITTSLRAYFITIGLLTPLPFIAGVILVSAFLVYAPSIPNEALRVLPAILAATLWLWITYASWRSLFRIFYKHAVQGLPLVIVLIVWLALAARIVHGFAEPLYSNLLLGNITGVGLSVLITSVVLSAPLVFLWTSFRLSAGIKTGSIIIITLALIAATAYVSFIG